jgi:hypothetical protein
MAEVHADGMAAPGVEYVYAANDWPAWQRALRRDATALYAARSNAAGTWTAPCRRDGQTEQPLPVAPFGVLFALCMLALWYREQSAQKSPAREAQG